MPFRRKQMTGEGTDDSAASSTKRRKAGYTADTIDPDSNQANRSFSLHVCTT